MELLTLQEAADRVNLSTKVLREAMHVTDPSLPKLKYFSTPSGRAIRIDARDLTAWVEAMKQ